MVTLVVTVTINVYTKLLTWLQNNGLINGLKFHLARLFKYLVVTHTRPIKSHRLILNLSILNISLSRYNNLVVFIFLNLIRNLFNEICFVYYRLWLTRLLIQINMMLTPRNRIRQFREAIDVAFKNFLV